MPLGVLIVNLGTTDAPRAPEVRRFLRRFLSDPRVVELPRAFWLPLLYLLVAPLRAPRSAKNYRRIWMNEGSPHRVLTARLRDALELELEVLLPGGTVLEAAYLYSAPEIAGSLGRLFSAGARRLVVLPLFPQSSGATTGAVYDQVLAALRTRRDLPELRLLSGYHDDGDYLAAVANSIREHWQRHGRAEHLLLSYHGLPHRIVELGDPYAAECEMTSQRLAALLELPEGAWSMCYQSRFGSARWLGPATVDELVRRARAGLRSVDVACPGFAVDCLETLEEIAIGGRERFLHAGGTEFRYVPALNDRGDHARALAGLVARAARP